MGNPHNETPEQRAERIESMQRAAKSYKDAMSYAAQKGGELMKQHGLRIVHSPRETSGDEMGLEGGLTVVWRYVTTTAAPDAARMIEAAAAYQHPSDPYIKTVGRYHAATRFATGSRALMRLPKDLRSYQINAWLIHAFGG